MEKILRTAIPKNYSDNFPYNDLDKISLGTVSYLNEDGSVNDNKTKGTKLFSCEGYWNDDNRPFDNYLITNSMIPPEGYDEEDMFFFGFSEADIKSMLSGICDQDFTITSYKEIKI